MNAVLRAKMRVTQVFRTFDSDGNIDQEQVKLTAVYPSGPKSANAKWAKRTPSAVFNIYINNPDVFGTLANGHEFYIDFIPAS